ncbi:GNAT family N-acetyltransferase [Aureispira sp. CCB-QB1]|uniref:lipid II:glycine glycyltransferase FemX n=1 Tax=Aureispira sp. CCB-QB1 TaxID=1313421 RepID=UPI000697790E|nr:GNAT family N-acetyltransferase [Aureispira sp. CCB-QB1]
MKIISLEDEGVWLSYLQKLPREVQDIYYTPAYYRLYENNGDGKAYCFIFEQGEKIAMYPYLLKEVPFVSNAFDIEGCYGYNGVLFNNENDSFKNAFYASFEKYCCEKNIIAEFTRFNPMTNNHTFSKENMEVLYDRNTVLLDLEQSPDDIWKKEFSSKNRNMIRKAIKEGVIVTRKRTKEAFKAFFELYNKTMVDLNAADFYFFKESYFLQILETIEGAWIYQATLDNILIGSILVFEYGAFAHYHLSARDRNYSRLASNNLLLYEAIKYARINGCRSFHFGGGNGGEKDPLYKFKLNFSKRIQSFYIGKKVHNPIIYDEVIQIWKNNKSSTPSNKVLCYRD